MVTRTDPERHKEQVRAANRARYRAVQTLVSRHQAEYDALYLVEAATEGVEPKPRGRVDAAQLTAQIAELQDRLKSIQAEQPV